MVFFLPTHNYENHSGPLCATIFGHGHTRLGHGQLTENYDQETVKIIFHFSTR